MKARWLGDTHGPLGPSGFDAAVRIILTVPDPDAAFASAVKAGAKEVYAVTEEQAQKARSPVIRPQPMG